ncbi:MAG: DUF5343 domain-containing protein [Chloroflexi bacterium]|nr:DUF5343 domain-containing protein [Chloroflexota bacterium]
MVTSDGNAEQSRAPAYIPFKTFTNAVEILEQGIPDPLDRTVWPSWSGGTQSQTLGAFKFLGLIDEKGNVQPGLRALVEARGDNRKEVLRGIIEEKYKEAIALGEANQTFQRLQDFFRQYGIEGGTLERVTRFFLDACEYTGLKCSVHWAKAKKTLRRSRKTTKEGNKTIGNAGAGNPPPANPPVTPNITTVKLNSGGELSLSLSVDLMALSKEDRDWLFGLIDQVKDYDKRNKAL